MSILRSLSSRARVGEPPTASTFTSFRANPPALAMSATKKVVPSCIDTTPMVFPLRSARVLISGCAMMKGGGRLAMPATNTKRAALVGLSDDAFDRGDCDLVRAGAQIVKDL